MAPSTHLAQLVRAGQVAGVPKQSPLKREDPAIWRLPVLAAGQGFVCWRTLTRNDTVILGNSLRMLIVSSEIQTNDRNQGDSQGVEPS